MHGISRRGGGRSVAPIAYVTEDAPTRKGRGPRLIRSTTVTQNPEVPAPALCCRLCDRSLIYLQTVIGGVKPPERWDYFECVCPAGSFEYRHRARKLRRTPDVPRPAVRVEKATVGSDATACLCLGGVARAIMPQQIDREKRQQS
jgi:hypothetical protein